MRDTLYSVLGVDTSANQEEIRRAYLSRIRTAHPDAGGNHELAAKLNLAYETLSDPELRQRYDDAMRGQPCPFCGQRLRPGPGAESHLEAHMRDISDPDSCVICGRLPTGRLTLKSNTGFLLWRSVTSLDGMLCMVCAKGAFREFQARNITRGPWGPVSLLATIFYLAQNWFAYQRIANIDAPWPRDPNVDEVLAGRPVFARPLVLFLVVALPALVALAAYSEQSSSNRPTVSTTVPGLGTTSPSPTPSTIRPTTTTTLPDWMNWEVGSCVRFSGSFASLTQCGSSVVDGFIVAIERWESSCPTWAEYIVDLEDGRVACIDVR